MTTVKQPSALPTRKLTSAIVITPLVAELWGNIMIEVYPAVAGPQTSMYVGLLVAALVGYMVKDRANT